jgi:hypothetical protein
MIRPFLAAALVVATLGASAADARRDRWDDDSWQERRENRRDARRAGVIAGAVAGSIASAAARDQAEQRFQECLYATGYDYDCERRLDYDRRDARRAARRSAWVVGGITREIVRD